MSTIMRSGFSTDDTLPPPARVEPGMIGGGWSVQGEGDFSRGVRLHITRGKYGPFTTIIEIDDNGQLKWFAVER